MSFSELNHASQLFEGELLNKAAGSLEESPSAIQKAWSAVVPAVMSAIVNKTSTAAGPQEVFGLAAKHHKPMVTDSDRLFSAGGLDREEDTIGDLFGSHINRLRAVIADYAKVKPRTATILVGIGCSASLGLLREHAAAEKWGASELSAYLQNQKAAIMASLPPGLDLSPVFGAPVEHHEPVLDHGRGSTTQGDDHSHDHVHIPATRTRHWLAPLVILAVTAILCLYFWTDAYTKSSIHATPDTLIQRKTLKEDYTIINAEKPVKDSSEAIIDTIPVQQNLPKRDSE